MQRESARRGFTISHQRVVLDLNFAGTLRGSTELTIVPTSRDLRTIYLNCRHAQIHKVSVSSYPAEYILHDALESITLSDPRDFHLHPELKRKVYSALADGDAGELAIAIPPQVHIRSSVNGATNQLTRDVNTAEAPSSTPTSDLAPIKVMVEYSINHPDEGFQFVLPSEAYPYRVPHAYTTPSSPDAARCWVPCVDSLWERCTWEFELIVPRYLDRVDDDADEERVESDADRVPVIVVCSGDLVEQVDHPTNSRKTIFLYSQPVPTSVQHIAFAAGPFHLLQIPADQNDEGSSQAIMHAFCLPGMERLLTSSVSFLRSAMNFYTSEFGSYPYTSHKLVFVNDMPQQRFDSATLSLVTSDILHGDDAIDVVFETRLQLAHALATQWIGINVCQKTWSDTWLINGLGLYMTGLFIKRHLGINEYRFRLRRDMDRVIELDVGDMPPICQPALHYPPDAAVLPFINMKSALVLHILDRRLGKSGTSLGLSRVLPKLFLSAISGEMPNNALSTNVFFKMCRKVCGFDSRGFAEQWIYASGCPRLRFAANFNRKRMAVEITMQQHSPAWEKNKDDPVRLAQLKPVHIFEGHMTVRIHEADGTPYEHVLDIQTAYKKYDVPFNTKYKRVRRNTKRFIARQQAAALAAQGDTEAAEAIGMIDVGFGLDVWEDAKERENWKVADWTEEEEQVMAGATYEWIRMDADFEWIATIAFEQPDFMWVSQLQRDRDVVAQLEAIRALSRQPTAIVSGTFTKTVLVTNYFYRIRVEAALGLVSCATNKLGFIGLFHLFKIFLRYCHTPTNKDQDLFTHTYVPLQNDFSDFSEYFVRKAVLTAVSKVRFENGKTPPIVRRFLIDQLRFNDNTNNAYSDARYISCIITALGHACVSTAPPEYGELMQTQGRTDQNQEDVELLDQATAEVERYRTMDRLVPSSHNVVTVSVLEWYILLGLANLKPSDPKLYLMYTREGNYTPVRIAAFNGFFLTRWYTSKLMRYVLSVVQHDPSRVVRRHVAHSILESLALLFTIGEIKGGKEDALLIEEDGGAQDKSKDLAAKKTEVNSFMKTLRRDKELGRNDVFRELIMPILLVPNMDHDVRWSMLQLNELFIKGAEEVVPKVILHIPITPVVEAPATPQPATPSTTSITIRPPRRPSTATPAPILKIKPPPPPRIKQEPLSISTGTGGHDAPAPSPAIRPKIRLTPRTPRFDDAAMPPPAPPAAPRAPKPIAPPKKDKPKAQTAGMPGTDVKACKNALHRLHQNKHSIIFRQPVDPVRDQAPNYYGIIKDPMDLSTMRSKLDAGMYKDRFEFEADFKLMIENAKTYNQPGQFAYSEAVALEGFFEQAWVRINATLGAIVNQPPPPPPIIPQAPRPVGRPPKNKPKPPVPVPVPVASTSSAAAEMPPPPPPVAPAAPRIKLKIGQPSSSKPSPAPAPVPAPPPAAPPAATSIKIKPLKPSKPARPSDDFDDLVDDLIGKKDEEEEEDDIVDDLLEEVMMIERESKPSKKDKTAKKDKAPAPPPPPPPARSPSPADIDMDLEEAIAAPPPPPPIKLKIGGNAAPKPAPAPAPPPPVAKPLTLTVKPPKAKEKEKAKASATVHRTPLQKKKCLELLKTLRKQPEALFFLLPVNPVLAGCPTYYDEIKHPMDFDTMGKKLDAGEYDSMEDFQSDVILIFNNSRQFNPVGTLPHDHADILEKFFKKEWSRIAGKLSYEEKRAMGSAINKLKTEEISFYFREPVDPLRWNIPTYFQIIDPKKARDLSTIKSKLDKAEYETTAAVYADIQLMVDNAIKFNGEGSPVAASAVACQERFREMVNESLSKKRKPEVADGGRASGTPPVKKARFA
ncbi:hypothetical protein AURDEDRAFT_112948 [Auricularia subglabra TFB-10046 SS5]|nr:hypothetical protein AURDEDRAFT_112948 [Auricularia subglabra TFB-10046 SS5]